MQDNRFFPEIHGNFGFGFMRLPMDGKEVDIEHTNRMVDIFMERGFNYFDTAHGYTEGKSETTLRQCLTERYPRDAYILTDKLSTHHFTKEEEIRPLFKKQLEACGVDYFDFYLMHAMDGEIYEKYRKCRAFETALEIKAEGGFRHFGISFHDRAEVLEQILSDYPEIEVVQIQFNYLDYEDMSVQSRKVYEVCEKYGKPVIVMEPVKGGSLVELPEEAQKVIDDLEQKKGVAVSKGDARVSEKKAANAAYAIRFAAGFPQIAMVLSGMSSEEQMDFNTGFMQDFRPLDEEETEALKEVCEVFRKTSMIACTSCRYCILENDCPKNIRIPELFSCYNLKTVFHNWNQDYYYDVQTRDCGKASDCIGCGACEKICPQHLPIREYLKDVAAEFEKKEEAEKSEG